MVERLGQREQSGGIIDPCRQPRIVSCQLRAREPLDARTVAATTSSIRETSKSPKDL